MKSLSARSLRALVLLAGLVGTFAFAAMPKTPVSHMGPIAICPPNNPNCGDGK